MKVTCTNPVSRQWRVALLGLVACTELSTAPPGVATFIAQRGTLRQVVQAEGNLRAVKSTVVSVPRTSGLRQWMRLAWVAPDGARVSANDVVFRIDPTKLQATLAERQSSLALAETRLQQTKISVASMAEERATQTRLSAVELERTRAYQSKDPVVFSRHQIIEASVDQNLMKAKQTHAKTVQRIERQNARSRIDLARGAVQRESTRVASASTALSTLEVRAPHDGLLVLHRTRRGDPRRVGDDVWPGWKLAEIPDLREMEVEVYVLEVDAQGLRVGIPATVVVESMPDRTFTGTIARVDTVAKRRVRHVPIQYIGAIVKLDQPEPELLKPGQRVRAELAVALHEGIVIPRHAVYVVDGDQVVFLNTSADSSADWKLQKVKLGAASIGRVVIEEGLEAGDIVALSDPREL